jgi:hypothetical protein
LYDLYARRDDGACPSKTEGAVTHGNGNSSGGTGRGGSGIAPKLLPAPNSDFYQLVDVLTAQEKAIVKKVRTYMETKVQPVINKYRSDDAPALGEHNEEVLPTAGLQRQRHRRLARERRHSACKGTRGVRF